MSRTTARPVVVAAFAALLFAAGCSSTVTGTALPVGSSAATGSNSSTAPSAAPSTAAPIGGGDAVAWVDKVCGSLIPFTEAAATQPQIDASDPSSAVKGLSDYLGTAVSTLDSALTGLKDAGPSPVKGGDEIVTKLSEALTKFRTLFGDAKTKIDAVDTTNLTELATALPAAVEPLQELANFPDPTADLKASPELDAAALKAPNCKTLT